MVNLNEKNDLKGLKFNGRALKLGPRTELWKGVVPFIRSLQIKEGLFEVMKRCLDGGATKRYASAQDLMQAPLPVVDLGTDKGWVMRSKIPLSCKEELGGETQKNIQVDLNVLNSQVGRARCNASLLCTR